MKGILLLAMAMVGVTPIRGEKPGKANLEICYGCDTCYVKRMKMMKMPCCKEVHYIWNGISKGPYRDCSPDGYFKEKQCIPGWDLCVCVDKYGKRKSLIKAHEDCPEEIPSAIREKPGKANYEICYGCDTCYAKRGKMMKMPCCIEVRDIWNGISKGPYRDCSLDGYFKEKQCIHDRDLCVCVDKDGNRKSDVIKAHEDCPEVCERSCPKYRRDRVVCASDGNTYLNTCLFEMAECKAKRNDVTLTVKNEGPCEEIVPLTLDGAEYGATSVHGNDNEKFGPKRAFQRAHFKSKNDRSFPWISAAGAAFPQTVHVTLPFATTVTSFSFRSRHEPFKIDWITKFSPTQFDFIGSNNCDAKTDSWITILHVTGVVWTGRDQEKSWDIPNEKQGSYRCYGFRVLDTINKKGAVIQDAKLFGAKTISPTTGKASSPPTTTTLPMTTKMTAKSKTATAMPSTTKLTTTTTRASATNKPAEYVAVTSENGTFHASSEFNSWYTAEKAFGTKGYWCSANYPSLPVCLWFEFKEPKRITKMKFKEVYGTGENGYQVFASDRVNDCGNPSAQTVLAKATASVFVTGKEFKNTRFFRCYGIRTYHSSKFVSAKNLVFGIEEGPTEAPTEAPTVAPTTVNLCEPNPCQNDGTCSGDGNCLCKDNYEGDLCEFEMLTSEQKNPVQNGLMTEEPVQEMLTSEQKNPVQNDLARIRLVNREGLSNQSGRLEVLVNGQWGSICDDTGDNSRWSAEGHVDSRVSKVVCSMYGYTGVGIVVNEWDRRMTEMAKEEGEEFEKMREETGMAPLRWSKLHCQGDEISLFDCSFSDDMRKMWQEHGKFALFNDQFSPYEDRYGRDCKSHETIGIYCF